MAFFVSRTILNRTAAATVVSVSSSSFALLGCRSAASTVSTTASTLTNHSRTRSHRSYFTNAQTIKKDDPYAVLGLSWGDGATTSEIKAAFRSKAAQLHPDVNVADSPDVAQAKFQKLQWAYETLTKAKDGASLAGDEEAQEQWRFHIWNRGDRIACDRTDVAGQARQRPVPPAPVTDARQKAAALRLGHPSGKGAVVYRSEFLGDGSSSTQAISSSVGRGLNKWVQPKEYKPWNNGTSSTVASAATRLASNDTTATK